MRLLQAIHRADLVIFIWFFNLNIRFNFTQLARIVSRVADGPLYVATGIVFIYLQHWFAVTLFIVAFSMERAIYFSLKRFCKRNRPAQVIEHFKSVITPADQFSFPSGHTSGAFLFSGLLLGLHGTVAAPLLIWSLCVGCSRVLLGVHFVTDTIAGALLGTSIAIFVLATI